MAQNSGAPRSQEDYITQVSEEIEARVTKRLSKEFSRTEDRILGALARRDNFLMNPLLPGRSGTTPEPTRNTSHNNQGTNEDGSQNDPHAEAGPFYGQTSRNVSLEEDHNKYKQLTIKSIGAEFLQLVVFYKKNRMNPIDKLTWRQVFVNDWLYQQRAFEINEISFFQWIRAARDGDQSLEGKPWVSTSTVFTKNPFL